MRKFSIGLILVAAFAIGIVVGVTPNARAGKVKCWTTCSGGELLECCRVDGKVMCRVLVYGC